MISRFPLGAILYSLALVLLLGLIIPERAPDEAPAPNELPPQTTGLVCPEPAPAPVCPPVEDTAGTPPPKPVETPPAVALEKAAFADLNGWSDDAVHESLAALRRSCELVRLRAPARSMGAQGLAGTVGDWKPVCAALSAVPDNAAQARAYYERWFTPYLVIGNGKPEGLFTGYYVPILEGRLEREPGFEVPLRRPPRDLVRVDLGRFDSRLEGEQISGRIDGGQLVPYYTRAEIAGGILDRQELEVIWLQDPVDAFFLQIQGSGLIRLKDGRLVRIGFAAKNGHPYTSIGRALIRRGVMSRHEASMQRIKAWLNDHAAERQAILNLNKSYVFFELHEAQGAKGAQGVVLTPRRSLAVDDRYIPYGVPLWREAEGDTGPTLRTLMIAQDTGSAIQGPVRGDFFWGAGNEAGRLAGKMKHRGRYYILLPKSLGLPHVLKTA
ncbi:MAG: murein transglycosylase A, partial [Alphaproteobacteria bacterium]|nr:murein transglycosylase A [Alphaproteobacteria bacterium]